MGVRVPRSPPHVQQQLETMVEDIAVKYDMARELSPGLSSESLATLVLAGVIQETGELIAERLTTKLQECLNSWEHKVNEN